MVETNVYGKLVKACSEFGPVIFDSKNPHYKSKYASLAAIKNAIEPALHKHGFIITQPCEALENGDIKLFTILIHESGEKISLGSCIIKAASNQVMGASITYQRRYLLSSGLSLFAEEDDDAESTEDRPSLQIKLERPEVAKAKPITLTPAQINTIKKMVADRPDIREEILKTTGKSLVADIEYEKFQSIMGLITARLKEEVA